MTTREGKRPAPFSLRLSADERVRLLALANGAPLGAYIKAVLFAEGAPRIRVRSRTPVHDQVALAEALARLGASRLASNLNQLAHAANSGALDVDPGTAAALRMACEDVRLMRVMLMRALRLRPDEVRLPRPRPTPEAAPPEAVPAFTAANAPRPKRITL